MDQLASKEVVDHILAHHGIKGMKWGVRRKSIYSDRHLRKGDKKFTKKAGSSELYVKIHNIAAARANAEDIDRINNKPHYKAASERGDFHDLNKPITQQYYKEHMDAFIAQVRKAAAEQPHSPSGNLKYDVQATPDHHWDVHVVEVKHASDPNLAFTVKVTYDEKGRIVKIGSSDMKQTSDFVTNFLAHHGIKGMKWGSRKGRSSGPSAVTVTQKGKNLKSSGGENHPPHPDAVAARKVRQQLQKSGAHSLSNQELRTFIERGSLVSQATKTATGGDTTTRLRKGNNFVGEVLKTVGNVKAAHDLTKEALA